MSGPARLLWWVLALACVLTTLGMTASAWLLLSYPQRPGAGQRRDVPLAPPAELGLDGLAEQLTAAHAVRDPEAFVWFMRLLDARRRLRTTRTVIRPSLTLVQLLPRLITGRGDPVLTLTFPEGFNRFDIAKKAAEYGIVDADRFLAAARERKVTAPWPVPTGDAEGYLFPDTYQLRVHSRGEVVVERMLETFAQRMSTALNEYPDAVTELARQPGLDAHGILTLASVVEKEAHLPRERPIIAGVFLNRLRDPAFRPHRLQADPTVAYGCLVAPEHAPSCADFDGRRVTPAMVRDPHNPYNTYRHDGLPPGPICNPGVDSVLAVLNAAKHEYYYFVANGDGSHRFSRTLAEHNAAIAESRRGR